LLTTNIITRAENTMYIKFCYYFEFVEIEK
jgi:hypothetical protein